MASKSGQQEPEKAEVIEELLDGLDTALDRVKVLYEQYFLGIQKQPPAYLHTDAERKIRDLTQIQIRNTALRYRFATLQQKYGAYNSYWRRTLRQIENGTYTRNLHKVGRQAAKTGAAVPEEILAAMPRRMREQVVRDREAALALARLRERQAQDELLTLADDEVDIDVADLEAAAFIHEPSDVRRSVTAAGAHRVDESDAEFDVDAFFASVAQDDAPSRDNLPRPAETPGDPPARSVRSGLPPSVAPRSRRPSTKRPPIDEGPPSFAESTGAATRKITGAMRAARPPSSPGIELAPQRSPTGRIQAARPPSPDDTEPRLSIPPVAEAGPAAATRKITGPMRAVRPPSDPGPEPAIDPASAAPARTTGQTAAVRPPVSGNAERRLSIPPIGAARPGAATRRITPPARAAQPPPDPEPAGPPPSAAPPGRATGESRAVPAPAGEDAGPVVRFTGQSRPVATPSSAGAGSSAPATVRITGQGRAVAPPPDAGAGPASGPSSGVPPGRITGPSRAVAAPSMDAGPANGPAGEAVRTTGQGRTATAASADGGPRRDAAGPADAANQAAGSRGIPPVVPAAGAKTSPASSGQAPVSSAAERPDPTRTAPSQATRPLRVAPGSAAAHAATPVETLTGPFPRIAGPPSSPAPSRAAAPLGPPPVPPPAPAEPSSPAPPASSSSAAPSDAAAPPGDSPRPVPPGRRTPPPMRAVPPPTLPRRPDASRSGAGERPPPEPRQAPPPGMTDADVNALYAKYVKAKQILGEEAEPGTYGKLLRTIHAQAPKIMEQYKAKGVDFSIVVRDNQVIIRAKPKP